MTGPSTKLDPGPSAKGYPLLFLTLRTMRNRLRVRLQRLREPKYLFGTLLGIMYFGFIFLGRGPNPQVGVLAAIGRARHEAELAATILIFGITAAAWVWPRSKPALPFSQAEVHHLFPAPISRGHLVRYRVLRSQVGTLMAGLIISLLFRPARVTDGLTVFLGLAIVMATMNLHLIGISLSRASHSARHWIRLGIVAAMVLVVAGTLAQNWSDLKVAASQGNLATDLYALSTRGAAGIVLWPFRAIAQLPMAESPVAFLAALPWALLVLLLNYAWIIRTDASFEEASAELSEKLEKLRQQGPRALRPPRASKRTPFTLAPQGRPETAILWKNLISMGRVFSSAVLFRVLPVLVLMSVALSRGRGDRAEILSAACVFIAGFALVLGPQMTRADLRQDLAALATLKTWPMRGAALVRGEVLAPALVLTTIIFLALTAAALLTTRAPLDTLATRWSLLLAALCVAPGMVLTQLLAQNALAVAFPSWVAIGNKGGGVDVVGQRLLVMIAVLLGLVFAVLPAAIVAAIGAGLVYLATGTVPVVFAGALAGMSLLVEAFLGSEIIGALLERSDISVLDAPDS